MNGTRLRRETPWPSRKGWQREPAADLLGQPDKLIAGGAVQEHRLWRLLPHPLTVGAHGKGLWPEEIFAKSIALFAGKRLVILAVLEPLVDFGVPTCSANAVALPFEVCPNFDLMLVLRSNFWRSVLQECQGCL